MGLDTEVLSECSGIVEGALRRELARHEQTDDVVRSECANGECGGEGGVDSAGESEEGAGESGLVEVVSDAGEEGLQGEVDRVCGGEVWELVEACEVEGVGGLDEGWHELFGRSVGEHEEAASVEDEFVVCAYLVEVEDRGLELGGGSCEGGESALDFSSGKGARGEVDQEVGGLGIVERVVPVAGSERGVVAGPEVFADRENECSAAEADGSESLSRQEVSGLIEDIVGGEEEFVVSGEDAAVVDEERGILQLVRSGLVGKGKTDEEGWAPDRSAGEGEECLGDRLVESGPVEEVAWRIACECEFGGDNEVDAGGARDVERSEDAVGVSGEVSDSGIELRCEDLQG